MVKGKTLYENQYQGIDKILASASEHPDLNFFVRLHPRSANDAGGRRPAADGDAASRT